MVSKAESEAKPNLSLQPVLEHRQRRGRRNIAWQAIPHLCNQRLVVRRRRTDSAPNARHASCRVVCCVSSDTVDQWCSSGVRGQGGQSPGGPECRAPEFHARKFLKIIFPDTRMFNCDTPNLGSVYGRLVDVGETFNRFADFGL